MRYDFKSIVKSLLFRTAVIYVTASLLLLSQTENLVPVEEWFGSDEPSYLRFLFFAALMTFWLAYVFDGLPRFLRTSFLLRFLWAFGPLLVFLYAIDFWLAFYTPRFLTVFLVMATGFLTTTVWALISSPFARRWMMSKTDSSDAVFAAERRLLWPLKIDGPYDTDETDETEIHVSPRLYLSLLAGIASVLFIVIETLMSELLGDTFLSGGYRDSILAALAVAGVMYPVHKVVGTPFLAQYGGSESKSGDAPNGASDMRSFYQETKRAFKAGQRILFARLPALSMLVWGGVLFLLLLVVIDELRTFFQNW